MGYKAINIVKLRQANISSQNWALKKNKINPSTGLVSAAIVTFVNGRSYKAQLKKSLRKIVGSNAFTQTSIVTATGYVRV